VPLPERVSPNRVSRHTPGAIESAQPKGLLRAERERPAAPLHIDHADRAGSSGLRIPEAGHGVPALHPNGEYKTERGPPLGGATMSDSGKHAGSHGDATLQELRAGRSASRTRQVNVARCVSPAAAGVDPRAWSGGREPAPGTTPGRPPDRHGRAGHRGARRHPRHIDDPRAAVQPALAGVLGSARVCMPGRCRRTDCQTPPR
jgi:hypothetical protein